MKLFIGSDRLGYNIKNEIISALKESGIDVIDIGPFEYKSVHYPEIAVAVSQSVLKNEGAFGVLICSTGVGMAITANKIKGIRAANCTGVYTARHSRLHNDANILCLGSSVVKFKNAIKMINKFLFTPFEGGKHTLRVKMINDIE